MNDITKVCRLEFALRTEYAKLRKIGGVSNIRAADAISVYLEQSDTASKLRFADTLMSAGNQYTENTDTVIEAQFQGRRTP